jgi:hypothetical protein
MKIEAVAPPVADVDRAKSFYKALGRPGQAGLGGGT